LFKTKGREAKLAFLGEVPMEDRHGLVVDACVVPATRTGERDAATSLIAGLPPRRVTTGGDKGYDTRGFVETLRTLEVTPHIAQKHTSHTLDGRTTRHEGYAISQRVRKRIEVVFGWMKTVGGLRKLRHRGGGRVNGQFLLAAAATTWSACGRSRRRREARRPSERARVPSRRSLLESTTEVVMNARISASC
jgi:hypothetical protein